MCWEADVPMNVRLFVCGPSEGSRRALAHGSSDEKRLSTGCIRKIRQPAHPDSRSNGEKQNCHPPTANSLTGEDGEVSQEKLDYYAARARGGHIGIITTEHFLLCNRTKPKMSEFHCLRCHDGWFEGVH